MARIWHRLAWAGLDYCDTGWGGIHGRAEQTKKPAAVKCWACTVRIHMYFCTCTCTSGVHTGLHRTTMRQYVLIRRPGRPNYAPSQERRVRWAALARAPEPIAAGYILANAI